MRSEKDKTPTGAGRLKLTDHTKKIKAKRQIFAQSFTTAPPETYQSTALDKQECK